MLFNSYVFVVFFAIVYALYRALPHRGQNWLLLVASYVFYGWWDWRFLTLIFASTVIDFYCGKVIGTSDDQTKRKRALGISMCANLGLLGFFKYFNFFIDSFSAAFGADTGALRLDIILPVGISFYTFQTMSYSIDIYRDKMKHTDNFFDFALFVSFFPQLVAGPIERASHLLPQVCAPRKVEWSAIKIGIGLIVWGYFKKLVVAENMAILTNQIFSMDVGNLNVWYVLLGGTAFAFQVYGDFSGYSNIARGVCKMLGFDLMVNFRSPYFVTNPADFWRHWHISLSTWLRDYLYIPLGGNRCSAIRSRINLAATMVLGGLWHGAKWNFVIWGCYHGLILMIFRQVKRRDDAPPPSLPILVIKWLGTAFLTTVGWLIFRASDRPGQVFDLFRGLTVWGPVTGDIVTKAAGIVFFGWFVMLEQFDKRNHHHDLAFTDRRPELRYCAWFYMIASIYLLAASSQQEFIYFQF